jgi:hypothetical protein
MASQHRRPRLKSSGLREAAWSSETSLFYTTLHGVITQKTSTLTDVFIADATVLIFQYLR